MCSVWYFLIMKKPTCVNAITAENFRRLRLEAGMEQEDIAREAMVSRSVIGHIETGLRGISKKHIDKFAELLHCKPKDFYKHVPTRKELNLIEDFIAKISLLRRDHGRDV
mgnify:CR=1 FL=1